MSFALRILAVIVFVLATVGVAPGPMTPLGLALWWVGARQARQCPRRTR